MASKRPRSAAEASSVFAARRRSWPGARSGVDPWDASFCKRPIVSHDMVEASTDRRRPEPLRNEKALKGSRRSAKRSSAATVKLPADEVDALPRELVEFWWKAEEYGPKLKAWRSLKPTKRARAELEATLPGS
jgi:hypothetical protein